MLVPSQSAGRCLTHRAVDGRGETIQTRSTGTLLLVTVHSTLPGKQQDSARSLD